MFRWWQHLVDMSDGERAKLLAKGAAGAIMVLLYLLGGASLYLRSRYLVPTPTLVTQVVTTVAPSSTSTLAFRPSATATLYPTMTPADVNGELPTSAVPSATPTHTVLWPTSIEPTESSTPFPTPTRGATVSVPPTIAPTYTTIGSTPTPTATDTPTATLTLTPTLTLTESPTATDESLGPPPKRQDR